MRAQVLCTLGMLLWLQLPAFAQFGSAPLNYANVNHQIDVLAAQARNPGISPAEYERRLGIVAVRVVAVMPQHVEPAHEAQALRSAARLLAPERLARTDLQPAWDRTLVAHPAFAALLHPWRLARESAADR